MTRKADPDGNGFACDNGEIEFGDDSSASASASSPTADQYDEEDAVVLPETGGPNPAAFALPSLVLLVAGGIFVARLVRK